MMAVSRGPAAVSTYVILVRLEKDAGLSFSEKDFRAAEHRFFFYYAFMKSNKRVPVRRYERRLILDCQLHKVRLARAINVEDLNDQTLLRSTLKPFTSFELKDFSFFNTLH
jgi:hypothetical protein